MFSCLERNSNLGLRVSVYLNLTHAHNRWVTTAGCTMKLLILEKYKNDLGKTRSAVISLKTEINTGLISILDGYLTLL